MTQKILFKKKIDFVDKNSSIHFSLNLDGSIECPILGQNPPRQNPPGQNPPGKKTPDNPPPPPPRAKPLGQNPPDKQILIVY